MHIRFYAQLEGPDVSIQPGDEREWPDADARRLIDRGYADEIDPPIAARPKNPAVLRTESR
jgi:hypothetical protein